MYIDDHSGTVNNDTRIDVDRCVNRCASMYIDVESMSVDVDRCVSMWDQCASMCIDLATAGSLARGRGEQVHRVQPTKIIGNRV